MDSHVQKINRDLVIGWLVIVAVLFFSYVGEVIKGERTIPYLIVFTIVTALPAIICLLIYKKKPDVHSLRYLIVVGYFLMYVFVMMTGSTTMVFSYILPMLSFLVLYHQPMLILHSGIVAMLVNVISIYIKYKNGMLSVSNSKDVEIQLALIFLCFTGSFVATTLYDQITKENDEYNEALDKKNSQIQKMTLQTIATIANTIDAKDEYTRGHSKRVSEYSVAIASELGMGEKELDELRSIALLHDIGKIGVPDAVLNKPGKLTNEEYQLMKRHTLIGADILKDIGMLPGIDIGAKYHHERWDGKGYPEGLAGEEIPYIARIIAVADAYDAMTSNRVYRKHLGEDVVLNEIKKGVGTQFDPNAASALIKLIEAGKMVNILPDVQEEPQEMQDVSTIVSRVIEKNEAKVMERLKIDELTGKYNRSYGEKLIKVAMEQGKGCFIILDIDNFRKLNDISGFLLGDVVLKLVADCLEQIDRKKLVARVGGDEFCVFIFDLVDEAEIRGIVEKFLECIRETSGKLKLFDEFSVSLGIEICKKGQNDFSEIYTKADKALYYAKQQGGGKYYFHNKDFDYQEENSASVDLKKLVALLKSQDTKKMSDEFYTNYPDIRNIYDFVKIQVERHNQHVQLLLFNLKPVAGIHMELEERDRVMSLLEKAISVSIRGVDVFARYSSTQRIIILVDHSREQVADVTERIMTEFYKMYDKKEVSISYDEADLGQEDVNAEE
jgi:diguanylate cyclase (GGDEF)-like protein/putative nucleotidyltransferase with HDIG domain